MSRDGRTDGRGELPPNGMKVKRNESPAFSWTSRTGIDTGCSGIRRRIEQGAISRVRRSKIIIALIDALARAAFRAELRTSGSSYSGYVILTFLGVKLPETSEHSSDSGKYIRQIECDFSRVSPRANVVSQNGDSLDRSECFFRRVKSCMLRVMVKISPLRLECLAAILIQCERTFHSVEVDQSCSARHSSTCEGTIFIFSFTISLLYIVHDFVWDLLDDICRSKLNFIHLVLGKYAYLGSNSRPLILRVSYIYVILS